MTLENIVYACYEEHKKHTSNWQHGKPQKTYYDLEGLKIFYEDVILCQEKVQIKNDFFPSCQHT